LLAGTTSLNKCFSFHSGRRIESYLELVIRRKKVIGMSKSDKTHQFESKVEFWIVDSVVYNEKRVVSMKISSSTLAKGEHRYA
jgi:hypothetical protein